MSEQVVDKQEKQSGFLKRDPNQERIERDEQELEELLKQQKGEAEPEGDEPEEPTAEPANAEEKTFKKRYGDLRRHSQKKEQDLQKQIDELRTQLESSTKQQLQYPTSEDELGAWMEKYPDVAKIVETIAMKKASEQAKEFDNKFAEIEEMRANAAREKAEAELLKVHPDLMEINASDEFHDWIEEQPKWIQDALYDNNTDAKAASRAIDLYKADKGIKKASKSDTAKEAAKSVSTKGSRSSVDASDSSGTVLESVVDKMSPAEYEKNAEVIAEAMRTGKFVYDLSGSAR